MAVNNKTVVPQLEYSPTLATPVETSGSEKEGFVEQTKVEVDVEAALWPESPTSKTALHHHHSRVAGRVIRSHKWLTRTKLGQTVLWLGVAALIVIAILASYYTYADQLGVDISTDAKNTENTFSPNTTYIGLLGQVISADTTGLVLTVSWTVDADAFGDLDGLTIAIYQDNQKQAIGNYSVDAYNDGITQAFITKLNLLGFADSRAAGSAEPTSVRYPFDVYQTFPTFAAFASTGEAVAISNLTLSGNVQGYTFSTYEYPSPYPGTPDDAPVPLARFISIQIGRAIAIQAFVVLLAMIMWFISLLVLWLTILGTVYGYALPSNFLGVPATILFAIPGIRSAMPNAPPFGTYLDLCSFLLCELIVALSFVAFNVTYAKRVQMDRFHKKQ